MDESWPSHRGLDSFDWGFVGIIVGLASLSIITLSSVTGPAAGHRWPIYWKQTVWFGLGSVAFLVMSAIGYQTLARWSYLLYGLGLLLLVVVMFFGQGARGAQRWIALGPIRLQPSEFVKIAVLLVLASHYSKQTQPGWWSRVLLPGLLAAPGFLLILKQPDLGTSLSFLSIYVTLLLAVGIKSKAFGVMILSALMIFPFVWGGLWSSLQLYQKERILSFVNPQYDLGGQGYQGLQSRIAVGSGELIGKGLHGGTQTQFQFLPEGHTDFIFAVFAEEWGFVGSVLLLGLFLALFVLGLDIAMRAKDLLGALLSVGLIGMLAFSTMVNVGMTVGLAPVVGIPLPLLSYGGSSTIMTMAALGLLFSVRRKRWVFRL
ncbi:MAG: rod shape-determining protein RodA [Nitrospira sp.]|nr:rod shape-determining protein RodA [Nitrospira sp.]MDD9858939.1 rod shape-determining protein RodA [Nitrospira sp.]